MWLLETETEFSARGPLNKGSVRQEQALVSSCEQRLAGEPRKRLFGYQCVSKFR